MLVKPNFDPGLSPCEENSGHWPRTLGALQLKYEPGSWETREAQTNIWALRVAYYFQFL
jgi:hypothetical protein